MFRVTGALCACFPSSLWSRNADSIVLSLRVWRGRGDDVDLWWEQHATCFLVPTSALHGAVMTAGHNLVDARAENKYGPIVQDHA